jgi:hypothetical protein
MTRVAIVLGATAAAGMPLAAAVQSHPKSAPGCASQAFAEVADSVASAFDTHQFVFIGSTHGGKKSHDFLLCVLSRPSFQRRATDILVEWGNPVHQALVDRYLIKLDPLPISSLKPVWFDTDAPKLWGRLPLIPEFYEAVRSINSQLDPPRRIRVIGGCEPIDWSTVKTAADVAMYPFKNNWAAHVITEHFAPDPARRLLVVYGEAHIYHDGGNMMNRLYASIDRGALFVVTTIDAPREDVAHLARLGDPARPFYASSRRFPSAGPYPRALFYVRDKPLAQHADAVVYLGPEPDPDLSNQMELTQAEKSEVDRRDSIKGDLRQLMRRRYENRDRWFRSHPNDLPPDPRIIR